MNRIAPPFEHAVVPHPDLGPKPSLKLVLGATVEQQGSRIKNQTVRTRCVGQLLRTPLAKSCVELLYRTFVSIHRIRGAKSSGYFIGELLLIDTLTATASVSSELL
jgi:hypothetical protein